MSVVVLLALAIANAESFPTATRFAHKVPKFSEGITFDQDNFGYLSHGNTISRFRVDPTTGEPVGKLETWAETGGPNGHKVLADGRHLVCDYSQHAVLLLDGKGTFLKFAAKKCGTENLRAPNDLSLDLATGGFYFTDPGGSSLEKPIGTVHYTNAEGETVRCADGLAFPNGIVFDHERKRLLVAETMKNRILAYPFISPGKFGPLQVFAELPKRSRPDQVENIPDGMCLDSRGNLYVAHYGMKLIQVLSPEGKLQTSFDAGNLTASNVAFAPDRRTLYITGGVQAEDGAGGVAYTKLFAAPNGLFITPTRKK